MSSLSADRDRDRLGGVRDRERDRSLGTGERLLDLLLERPLSLPPRSRDLDLDLVLDLGDLERGDLDLGDLDLDLDPERDRRDPFRADSRVSLILRPWRSAPSNFSNAVFMSLSVANSTHPSFRLVLWASA